jgi:hypothetical protein
MAFKIGIIERNMSIELTSRSTCSVQFRAENPFSAAC